MGKDKNKYVPGTKAKEYKAKQDAAKAKWPSNHGQYNTTKVTVDGKQVTRNTCKCGCGHSYDS